MLFCITQILAINQLWSAENVCILGKKDNDNQFQLSDSMQGNNNTLETLVLVVNLLTVSTSSWFVYNVYREYKHYNDWYGYYYLYYWNWRGTYSGHDMNGRTYGLGNQNWDRTVFFSQNRSHAGGYNGSNYYFYNDAWHRCFGTTGEPMVTTINLFLAVILATVG